MRNYSLSLHEVPLGLWAFGYIEFVLQACWPGRIPLGLISAIALAALMLISSIHRAAEWNRELQEMLGEWRATPSLIFRGGIAFSLLALAVMLVLGSYSALRPPFLPQEYDAVNYQMGVPRQLLVRGQGLGWIPWSVADLWPMALQWGIAPLSGIFGTIQKLPQFLFALGAGLAAFRLGSLLSPHSSPLTRALPALALFSAHGLMIQIGSGMMDLPSLYLLLLSASALLRGRLLIAALSLAVYTSSKAFHPFQIGALWAGALIWWRFRSPSFPFARFTLIFSLLSALLLARPMIVSLQATGTPLFPFASCRLAQGALCSLEKKPILERTSQLLLATRNSYGHGRGPSALISHLWRVAVPTLGVNNEFDYPLGLPWLLFLVLLAFTGPRAAFRNPVLMVALGFWALWWMNSHQSRWLYPTLAFGLLGTLPAIHSARKIFPALIAASFLFTLVSMYRSLAPTLALSSSQIRAQEEGKVQWDAEGRLVQEALLYVNKAAPEHAGQAPLWVLR